MPKKPSPFRQRGLRRVNEYVTNELHIPELVEYTNPILAIRAVELELEDIAAGNTLRNRYTRVMEKLMETGASKPAAQRAISEGKRMRIERFQSELPFKQAELSIQLQRIADANEDENPMASVAAIREISRINGLHAPKKIEITGGATVQEASIDAMLAVLDDRDRDDLRRILANIERAKSDGRLQLAEPIEAELVDDPGDN